eukprot:UN33973
MGCACCNPEPSDRELLYRFNQATGFVLSSDAYGWKMFPPSKDHRWVKVVQLHEFVGITLQNQRVIKIKLSNKLKVKDEDRMLIPRECYPSLLQVLDLSCNKLSGVIPTAFPQTMHWINLENNKLTGHIPTYLPPQLEMLNLSKNLLEGN